MNTKPNEKGTAIFTLVFIDENGDSVVPSNLAWQLMTLNGEIINGRNFEDNSFTGNIIVLSGNDLVIFKGIIDDGKRVLSIQGDYDSTVGNNLPLIGEYEFTIKKVLGQENIIYPF